MKQFNTNLIAIGSALLAGVLFLGNSSGAANNNNYNTGAPSAGGGQELTCSLCHRSGSYGEPQVAVTFAEQGSDVFGELTTYTPGQTYRVSVAVGYLN